VEEFTGQNQEMRLRLQQEHNHFETNQDDNGDSQRKDDCRRPVTPEEASSDLLREMRKEMDKLDWMVRRTNSPFTTAVLECPMPSKFCLP